jgi:hypothetical protein
MKLLMRCLPVRFMFSNLAARRLRHWITVLRRPTFATLSHNAFGRLQWKSWRRRFWYQHWFLVCRAVHTRRQAAVVVGALALAADRQARAAPEAVLDKA